jgi:uncharacterized Zn finger protein
LLPQEQEGVNQLFEFSKALTDKGIDWTVEHKDKLFKPKEAKKITRSIAESAYFNSLVGIVAHTHQAQQLPAWGATGSSKICDGLSPYSGTTISNCEAIFGGRKRPPR